MVNWSDKDHFACDNKMIHCHYSLFEYPRTSDTARNFYRELIGREDFSLYQTDQQLAP